MKDLLSAYPYFLSAFIIGSIPFGVIFSILYGKPNPTTVGSRNIGFTNVLRTAGKTPAFFTLFFDILKGFIVCFVARDNIPHVALFLTGTVGIFGHLFSPFLKFAGGKGVATGYGVLLAIEPSVGFSAIAIWIITFYLSRTSSVSALTSYLLLPVIALAVVKDIAFVLFVLFVSAVILVRHKENIKRILSGEELKLKSRQ